MGGEKSGFMMRPYTSQESGAAESLDNGAVSCAPVNTASWRQSHRWKASLPRGEKVKIRIIIDMETKAILYF